MSTRPATHQRARGRSDDGFTLAEVVVAVGVTMVVLLSGLAVFITVASAQRTAEGTDRAVQLANSRIERLRQMDWDDIGFYTNTYNTDVTAAGSAAYAANQPPSEPVVILGPTEQNTAANVVHPYAISTSAESQTLFKIYTYATWGADSALGLPRTSASQPATNQYTYKRVRVVITWTNPGSTVLHKVTSETLFSPAANDAVPPGITVTNAEGTP